MAFPATKEDLEKHAKEHGADKDVMETLRAMTEQSYETMADVKGIRAGTPLAALVGVSAAASVALAKQAAAVGRTAGTIYVGRIGAACRRIRQCY